MTSLLILLILSGDETVEDAAFLTKSQAGDVELYDIKIEWFTVNPDTTCTRVHGNRNP